MTKIKDLSIIILIVFIIASILYGIHMFRYEFIYYGDRKLIIRYDRITNEQCYSASTNGTLRSFTNDNIGEPFKTYKKGLHELYPCNDYDLSLPEGTR